MAPEMSLICETVPVVAGQHSQCTSGAGVAATAEISFPNWDALPVCLPSENLHRLVSLWDLMNQFNLSDFSAYFGHLWSAEQRLRDLRDADGLGAIVPLEQREFIRERVDTFRHACWEMRLNNSHDQACQLRAQLDDKDPPISAEPLRVLIFNLRQTVINELGRRRFLWVNPRFSKYVDQEESFGKPVHDAFQSARKDIIEAGNCLAAECGTAAVFHLMRVAEHGLRALAYDRNLSVPKGPIELATWDEIIRKLEDVEEAIQNYPKTLAREAQFEFYHGAMMEFKRFKNKFRNRIMHTRDEYDVDEAQSAFIHVKDFMGILASKIAENVKTPEIWV